MSIVRDRLVGLVPDAATRRILRHLWRDFVRAERATLALALVFMALVAATTAAYPRLIERLFNLLEAGSRDAYWTLAAAVLAVVCVRSAALYLQSVLIARATLRVVTAMQRRLHAHLLRADLARSLAEPTGTLIARFTHDTSVLRNALAQASAGVIRDTLTVAFLIGVIVYTDWRLALVTLAVYPLVSVPIALVGRSIRRTSAEAQRRVGELTALLGESLSGLRLIKTYRLEPYEEARAGSAFARLEEVNRHMIRARSQLDPLLELIGGVAVLAVVAVVVVGGGSVGSLMAFVTALLLASQPVRSLGALNATVQEGISAAERYYALLEAAPRITERPAARALVVERGEVCFDGVSLSYGEIPALRCVTFTAPAGKTVALVGRSGSGKSSLFNLVPRLYDPEEGAVRIDGVDVRDVSLVSLRDAIAVVSQEALLFDDTIRANIAFGRPGATDAEIEAAARNAAAHAFIERLPQGYTTRVGERGSNLSGGERQRVALARAFLRCAPILLLDEATSALDAESETLVQEALRRLCRGRTTLVIAHRLSTVRTADLIVVLDAGRVVEMGTHEELLRAGGLYAEFARLQFGAAR